MTVRTLSQKTAWSAGRTSLFTLSPWYFFLFHNTWQVVQIGICPWALRMTPDVCENCENMVPSFVSPVPASHLPCQLVPVAMQSSAEEPCHRCHVSPMVLLAQFAKSGFSFLHVQMSILIYIQPLEGWYRSSSPWLYQAVIDVCAGTGTQLDRVTVPFPFPKTKSKGSPRAVSYLPSRLL